MWSDEAGEVTNAYWPKVDCILMGRKTYEVALANNPGGGDAEDDSGIKTYVFSRTLKQEDHKGATIISENAVEFVRELKQQDGKEICLMGGGDLAKTLFEAGLIDEIGFNIHPVMLGSGIPAFYAMSRQIDLELMECRQFNNGCVYVQYRVKN